MSPMTTLTYKDYISERADLLYRFTNLPLYYMMKILNYHYTPLMKGDTAMLPEYFDGSVICIDVQIRKYHNNNPHSYIDYWYQFYGMPDGSWKDLEHHIILNVLNQWSESILQMKKDGQLDNEEIELD